MIIVAVLGLFDYAVFCRLLSGGRARSPKEPGLHEWESG